MSPDPLMFMALIGAHCFFDYAGQGDFMARAKNPVTPVPGVPYYLVMNAHCAIHGAAVALITGIWWLFFCEFFAHMLADYMKCIGRIGFKADQVIHLACKAVWFVIAVTIT